MNEPLRKPKPLTRKDVDAAEEMIRAMFKANTPEEAGRIWLERQRAVTGAPEQTKEPDNPDSSS